MGTFSTRGDGTYITIFKYYISNNFLWETIKIIRSGRSYNMDMGSVEKVDWYITSFLEQETNTL